MRRITVAGAAFLCALATAAPAAAAKLELYLTKSAAHHTQIYPRKPGPWIHGQTIGYWGKFTSPGTQGGSYRATCMWLANTQWPTNPKQDDRLSCTIVIAFEDRPPGVQNRDVSGVVLQGLVKRPIGGKQLFERPTARKLVVTGGTGTYAGAYGYADLSLEWIIVVHYGLLQVPL
jgi:hypothetical protein